MQLTFPIRRLALVTTDPPNVAAFTSPAPPTPDWCVGWVAGIALCAEAWGMRDWGGGVGTE